MRCIVGYPLWIGNQGDIRKPQGLFDAGIEAVVELADNETFAGLPREIVRCRFPLSDSGDNPAWLLRMTIRTVASFLENNVRVLVCCSGGMNRSICVSAAGVAVADRIPLNQALLAVTQSGPADVSPRLLEEVSSLFRQMGGHNWDNQL